MRLLLPNRLASAVSVAALCLSALSGGAMAADVPSIRPKPRPTVVHVDPVARWDFRNDGAAWSAEVLSALRRHGAPLVKTVPRDIATWCPGYASAPPEARRAFWNGFLSALAKYESTYRPTAVGGGGRWYGLLQILPATARHHGCKAGTGGALKDGGANLSCAIRIMSRTVTRDGVIHAKSPRWSGVSADWGPMRSDEKRAEMARWLRGQPYCALFASPRPKWKERPEGLVAGPILPELRPEPRPESRPALRLAMLDPADLLPPRRPGAR